MTVGGSSGVFELRLRRYRCTACEAVILVGPRGLVRRRLFTGSAIAAALMRWGVRRQTAAEVRGRVSPWRVVGSAAAGGWVALRRWARAIRTGGLWPEVMRDVVGGARQVSRTAVLRLAALAPVGGDLEAQVFAGAARAR